MIGWCVRERLASEYVPVGDGLHDCGWIFYWIFQPGGGASISYATFTSDNYLGNLLSEVGLWAAT